MEVVPRWQPIVSEKRNDPWGGPQLTQYRACDVVEAMQSEIVTSAVAVNRRFYDGLWDEARLIEAQHFNTWPLVSSLLDSERPRLEIAPGLRPRLPLAGTRFVDISSAALDILRARG